MFMHAYQNYMLYAFPADEIKPISCVGRHNEGRGTLDDVLGEYALTLIDSMSTMVVMGEFDDFEEAVRLTIERVDFRNNVTVSVFESTIRVVGGLLSAHLLAEEFKMIPWYNGELLYKAQDLVDRLLPAFNTLTGIPYQRVNLIYGVNPKEVTFTCTSCAGTLVMEFELLSRLLGDDKYKIAAKKAITALWERRSGIGLFGNTIDVHTGVWREPDSSVGAGIDSFYEYLLKSYLFFNNEEHYKMFNESYSRVMLFVNHDNWYPVVNMNTGDTRYTWTDSLSAFWPGLQVLYGDVDFAKAAHIKYFALWLRYGGIPERFDYIRSIAIHGINNYPLRPEFVESTYLLYRATMDPWYLEVGKTILDTLQQYRVRCGYASLTDVETKQMEDRMDSFFLSETSKYLYLLFDNHNFLHKKDWLFTTEGHPLPMNLPWHKKSKIKVLDKCKNPKKPSKPQDYSSYIPKDPTISQPISLVSEAPPPPMVKFVVSGIERTTLTNIILTEVPSTNEVIVNKDIYGQMALFGPRITSPLSFEGIVADPLEGCSLNNPLQMPGKVVLMKRGRCLFREKVLNAQKAGATAVIIANDDPYGVFTMGTHDDVDLQISIPALMVTRADGQVLLSLMKSRMLQLIEISPLVRGEGSPSAGSTPPANTTLQLTVFDFAGYNPAPRLGSIPHGHSLAFVNENSIIFSLDGQNVDYTNKKVEFTFMDKGKLDFYRETKILKHEYKKPKPT
uniref:alpha-1,2-Mannosidase n=1 Tax=Arcella intermedia TaxID=1963864 RepID=A0A6B2KYH5_9EUKA